MTTYTLRLCKTLDVPVRLLVHDGKKLVTQGFVLIVKRLASDEIKAAFEQHEKKEKTDFDLLADIVLDWRGQVLVEDEDGVPAEYSVAALELMCSVIGVRDQLVRAVFGEQVRPLPSQAQEEARQGN